MVPSCSFSFAEKVLQDTLPSSGLVHGVKQGGNMPVSISGGVDSTDRVRSVFPGVPNLSSRSLVL